MLGPRVIPLMTPRYNSLNYSQGSSQSLSAAAIRTYFYVTMMTNFDCGSQNPRLLILGYHHMTVYELFETLVALS